MQARLAASFLFYASRLHCTEDRITSNLNANPAFQFIPKSHTNYSNPDGAQEYKQKKKKSEGFDTFTFFFVVAFKQARPEKSDQEIFTSFILFLFSALSLTAVPCKNLTPQPGQELESEADLR